MGVNRELIRSCFCGHCAILRALSWCLVDMEALQLLSGAPMVSLRHLGLCFGITICEDFLYWVGLKFHHGDF